MLNPFARFAAGWFCAAELWTGQAGRGTRWLLPGPCDSATVRAIVACVVFAGGLASRNVQAASWDLHTADTEMRIGVVENRPVIEHLAAVGSTHNWISAENLVPLMTRAWRDGQEISIVWQFREGIDAPAIGQLTLEFTCAESSLVLRSVWRARPGRGPIEHWMEIENVSPGRVTVSHQDSLTLAGLHPGAPATLWWIQRGGSNASTQGGTFSQPLSGGLDLVLASDCEDGASPVPWLAVQAGLERGLYVGWEFSGLGRVHARATADADGIDLDVGNHREFKTDVEPGEVFLVPPAFVGCYNGDLDEGSASLHRFVLEKLRPPVPLGYPDPILAYNLYLDAGGNEATESDVLRSAEMCRDLGFEAFMPDAMWFPETGDWRWDPRRFPQGVQPIEAFIHRSGLKLALWCAWTNGGISEDPGALSVRGRVGHPEWFNADYPAVWNAGPFAGGQVCLGCSEAQQWATEKTQWLVREHRLDYLKHDCGPITTRCNKTNHRHHYGVDASYWATLGYYQIQHKLRQAFPHLLLENCSGGGHIKDFGVMARTHYTVSTDTLSNLPNRQTIYDSTWALPPIVLQCYTYDNVYPVRGDNPGTFLWRSAMMGAWQIDPTDTLTWTEEEKNSVRRSVEIYRQWIRPMLTDVQVHHILPRPDGLHWDGMFYWSPARRRGTLYVWRPDSPDVQQTVRLKGLQSNEKYWLWCEDGSISPGLHRGDELMRTGLQLQLAQEYTSDLVFLQEEALGKPAGLEAPGDFVLHQPTVESGVFSVSARLIWESSAGAHRYVVCVADDPEFQHVIAKSVVLQPTVTLTDLPASRKLYWRVEANSWGGVRIHSGPAGAIDTPPLDRPVGLVFLSDMVWAKANAGADNPVRRDVNYFGKPITIHDRVYRKGLWTHAYPDATPADVVFDLAGQKFGRFGADVGLDDASHGGSVVFQVLVDGLVKAESPLMRPRQVHSFRVDITDACELTLRVFNGGDNYACDHAAWGAARLLAPGVVDVLDKAN
ncbi:MAG: NPCBM/NEW2 domain-containing protein [Pirellulaceae bacterium]